LAGERDHEQSHRVEVADAGIAYVQGEGGFPVHKTHPPSPLPAPTSRRGAGYKIHRHRRLLEGLIAFGEAVVPGSARVIASVGDETNALLMVSVKAAFAPGAPQLTLPAARL